MVKIVSFSMAGIIYDQNRYFQHGWNMLWSKLSFSACLEYVIVSLERVMVKILSFSMFLIICSKNEKVPQTCLRLSLESLLNLKTLDVTEGFLNNTPSLFVGQIFICGDR
jgi:hypothetical protein